MRFLIAFVWVSLVALLPAHAQRPNASFNMPLLGRWQDPARNIHYNDIWGYAAPDGREYAIIGSSFGTNFVDVSVPTAPRLVKRFPGRARFNISWRDFKTFSHYAYAIADHGLHSPQIFDLQYLPDSVHLVYDSDSLRRSAHTIFIDGSTMYLSSNLVPVNDSTTELRPLDVFSLANPVRPRFIGTVRWARRTNVLAHQVFARHDTAFISSGYQGMWIYDMRNPASPVRLDSLRNYPSGGYNHSSWRSPNGRLLVVADELPEGLPLKLFDISNLHQPVLLSRFNSLDSLATPHVPFFVTNRYIVSSWYHDGVQVWDVANPAAPIRIGYFDTYPDNDSSIQNTGYNGFEGCWGVYPLLPSGNIIASDITYGLLVLAPPYNIVTGTNQDARKRPSLQVFPNPATSEVQVVLNTPTTNWKITVLNALGQPIAQPPIYFTDAAARIDISGLPAGVYSLMAAQIGQIPCVGRMVVTPR